jgi:hypothetical protein
MLCNNLMGPYMKTSGTKDNNFVARVAIGRDLKPQSAVFRIWSPKGKSDVYAAVSAIAGKIKISLHGSGKCNAGLTTQFAASEDGSVAAMGGSRHQSKWTRKTHMGSRVVIPLQFAIPASQMRLWKEQSVSQKITWLEPPKHDHSVIISCIFSGQSLPDDNWPGRFNGTNLLGSKILPNGEKFWLIWQDCPTSMLEHDILAEAEAHMKQQKMVRFSGITHETPPPQRQLIFKEYLDEQLLVIIDALIKN